MRGRRRGTAALAIAGWPTAILIVASCGAGPADRVMDELEQRRPAREIAVDAAVIEDYAPDACEKMRRIKAEAGLTIEEFSSFVTSAPPGTYPWLPVQGLTDGQLTDIHQAIASEYCADALP